MSSAPTSNHHQSWISKIWNRQASVSNSPHSTPMAGSSSDASMHSQASPEYVHSLLHSPNGSFQERRTSAPSVISHQRSPASVVFDSCKCCGTVIKYPADVSKVRCLVCHTHTTINEDSSSPRAKRENTDVVPKQKTESDTVESSLEKPASSTVRPKAKPDILSYQHLKQVISKCSAKKSPDKHENNPHTLFKPLEDVLLDSFSSYECLNSSFKLSSQEPPNHRSPNLNFNEIKKSYALLLRLPTKRPFFKLLLGAIQLLRHPPVMKDPSDINWLLILLEIPILQDCLISGMDTCTDILAPNLRASCYEVLKRAIGLLSYADRKITNRLTYWWSRLPHEEFIKKIDFLNLYITFQLTRCINYELYNSIIQPGSYLNTSMNDDINYKENLNAHFIRPTSKSSDFGLFIGIPVYISSGRRRPNDMSSSSTFWANKKDNQEHEVKIRLQQYGDDWHLRTAGRLVSFLFIANKKNKKVSDAVFYNNLVDYVNVKQDFDAWQFNASTKKHQQDTENKDSLQLVVDYLQAETKASYLGLSNTNGTLKKSSFTFCQFPFLLSLAAKISILEHEAKRMMERKAEEAFIQSLNKKMPFDVYFKIRVRRNYITTDSLRSIKAHQADFKKLLRVEFVDEPGIDAGGLKKEWFLLLTKDLFNADKGLFSYDETSQFGWFAISSIDNDELYYLVGVVLGLAIYNSTILDLRLPKALYKKLMGQKVTLNDYIQLNPDVGHNFKRLMKLESVDDLELYFDVSYADIFGEMHFAELVENGSQIKVTNDNKYEYVEKYVSFFLNDLVKAPFESFRNGFQHVIGGNALSLFTPEEIELILIGEDYRDQKIDSNILKSVTKYNGFSNTDDVVTWFWEHFEDQTSADQRKILLFITGSDRLPATGLPSMTFKITKLVDKDLTRLPIAHTCFNELCLYNYPTREIFANKLHMAIYYSEGFGLR
ncbi:hypothetical protein OGAPHI_004637 [Ogataea philodendri]|uniref:HECT-type E3 ubiquitin transferase n=1 Tax=Ogataea philodendri TaxID=1378263 RepID=A0A9P8P3A0_9ASCO|nr:uncharacterized protein OGAPHI_004637 [Ogataea philodendri]KAH3664285.1 hypothetical protein OGAPHI_004637 [Ogataea philodendri]